MGWIEEAVWSLKATSPDPEVAYYDLLSALVRARQPKCVVELGTFLGKSAAAMLSALPADGRLLSIDATARALPDRVRSDNRFSFFLGDSRFPETCGALQTGIDFLFVDTEHSYEQVSAEWQAWRPLLADGAVICFDDIHLNEGMARFWSELDCMKWDTGSDIHHTGFGIALNIKATSPPRAVDSAKRAVAYVAHDDAEWFETSLQSVECFGDVYLFLNERSWAGQVGDTCSLRQIAERHQVTVIDGDWISEEDHRQKAYQHLRDLGYGYALVIDTDEILEERLLQQLAKIADDRLSEIVHIQMDTYWSSPEYVVRPREPIAPCVLIDLREAFLVRIRDFAGGRRLFLGADHGVMHHLSYCGSDERIRRKTNSWSHRSEVVPDWWDRKWLAWQADRFLMDLHPTHPAQYSFTERIVPPGILVPHKPCGEPRLSSLGLRWPTVSVVIPLHGGREDIQLCLESLAKCKDLLKEVLVIDNASPDRAGAVVKDFQFATLIEQPANLGFAAASNIGAKESTGEVVLFLNSDTYVPRAGLLALIEDLCTSGTVAAAGPVSNAVGHSQRIGVTYTSLNSVDLFAEDLADSGRPTRDSDMLVGFCLAVRRAVLDEIGVFDESFGLGLFEDNDLCYRMRRAGYRLLVSQRAFVHHKGQPLLSGLESTTSSSWRPTAGNTKRSGNGTLKLALHRTSRDSTVLQ